MRIYRAIWYIGQAKRLQSVMTSLTRYCIFDHSPWQKHRNYFILRSEHLEQSNLMLQEYWISHSILRTRGMRKYIIFLVILAYFLVLSLPAIYTTLQQPHGLLMSCLMALSAMRQQIESSWQSPGVNLGSRRGWVLVQEQSEFLR